VAADADTSPRRKLGCPLFQNSNKSDCPNTDRNYNNNQIKSTQIKDYSISDNPTHAANNHKLISIVPLARTKNENGQTMFRS